MAVAGGPRARRRSAVPMAANRAGFACLAGALVASLPAAAPAFAQSIAALPDQTSRIRLSNHDVNHIVCVGGDIDDVKFSAEKGRSEENTSELQSLMSISSAVFCLKKKI